MPNLSTSSWWKGILLAGVVFRLLQYASLQSLWHDEAALVLNVIEKGLSQMASPLDRHQVAPLFWLYIEKLMVMLLGPTELVLRFFPFVASLLALLLFGQWSRSSLQPHGALGAVAFFAFSDRLIWHGAEAKPYSTDVLVAVLILSLGWTAIRNRSRVRFFWVTLGASVLFWFSFPAVFSFGAVTLTFLFREPSFFRRFFGAAALCLPAVLSLILLLSVPSATARDPALLDYWAKGFPPWDLSFFLWFFRNSLGVFDYVSEPVGICVAVLYALGIIQFFRQEDRALGWLLLLPLLLTLIAAGFGAYPWKGSRITLFLAPPILFSCGEGARILLGQARESKWRCALAATLVVLPLLLCAGQGAFRMVAPRTRHHLRPVASILRTEVQTSDSILVLCPDEFRYYWSLRDSSLPEPDVVLIYGVRGGDLSPDLRAQLLGANRLWVVTSGKPLHESSSHRSLLETIEESHEKVRGIIGKTAGAILFVRNNAG